MSYHHARRAALIGCVLLLACSISASAETSCEFLWRYRALSGACEIGAYSANTRRLFVTVGGGVDVVVARSGAKVAEIAIPKGFHATSVACAGEIVAVAWAADDKHERGRITFYKAENLKEIASHQAGYLPDMIVFTPDGRTLLAANEGEPTADYSFDPEASVSIVTRRGGWNNAKVREATFTKFNADRDKLIAKGLRVFGRPKAGKLTTVAEDVEPEYIALRADGKVAWVTLQENNAIAEVDIDAGEITEIHPLGLKSFRSLGSFGEVQLVSHIKSTGLDASDTDGGAKIRHWPIWGMYQPDGIATFQQNGQDFLVTANEGDPRDYYDFSEAMPVGQLTGAGILLDERNPAARLTGDEQLGRLEVSRFAGDSDGDGDLDKLVCLGTRSFSIWKCGKEGLQQVFDSGSEFEQIVAKQAPELFNADSQAESTADVRSVIRGPEPENLVLFEMGRRSLVAIGLERTGGAVIYDISDPAAPKFLKFLRPDEATGERDLAPEGLVVIPADQTSGGRPVLILCNEGSGTMTAWEISIN